MRIPEVRKELTAISERLLVLVEELKRRPAIRKAPVKSAKMTPALEKRIRAYARRWKQASYHEIASALKVNIGRVSTALRGFRR